MRTLNMLMGVLLIVAGIFMIANEGITFISFAFVVGLLFIVAGIAEALSCNSYRGDEGDKSWGLDRRIDNVCYRRADNFE